MDPLLPLPSEALRAPLLQPSVVSPTGGPPFARPPVIFPGGGPLNAFHPSGAPPPQQQGGLTIGKILFDSKDKPKEDGKPRRRGFSEIGPPSERTSQPYERRSRPKKRVRERDQDLESSESEDSEAEKERERERLEREERRKKLDEEHRAAEEKRLKEEEERRLQREKLEKEAQEKIVPTQTIVVKGISIRATEEDVARSLADWGPLPVAAVRIIKDRITKISRGFAFVDFPSVKAAKKLMEDTKTQKILLDGRKLHFEYTRPSERQEEEVQDWVCSGCTAVNFARRTTCFKCSIVRTPDAKIAELGAAQEAFLKQLDEEKTDNLIVRGLEPDVDEAALHYTFAKFGPIKELKVIRDRNTLVSRGFAFVHYQTTEEAKAALLATNNTRLDKTSSTILRVAFARPQPQRQPPSFLQTAPVGPPATNGVNTLPGATWQPKEFGGKKLEPQVVSTWEPKEFGMSEEERKLKEEQAQKLVSEPVVNQVTQKAAPVERKKGMESLAERVQQEALSGAPKEAVQAQPQKPAAAAGPSAGFVWDEASGYYYDAASGYYYDGHRGLYYNGHTKVWYTFDNATQSYKEVQPDVTTSAAPQTSAPAATTGWPQQQQAPHQQPATVLQPAASSAQQYSQPATSSVQRYSQPATSSLQQYPQPATPSVQQYPQRAQGQAQGPPAYPQAQPAYTPQQSQAPTAYGQAPPAFAPTSTPPNNQATPYVGPQFPPTNQSFPSVSQQRPPSSGPIGYNGQPPAYGQPSWQPQQNFQAQQNVQPPQNHQRPQTLQQPQQFGGTESMGRGAFVLGGPGGVGTEVATGFGNGNAEGFNTRVGGDGYRDRAAERRGLYGVPPLTGRNDNGGVESGGYGRQGPPPVDEPPVQFERVDQSRALGAQNVGNKMLRNMGWQEGQGLGRGGGGMIDPIKAERMTERAGLGVEVPKIDPRFEILPGDSYKVQMQKKMLQRFSNEQQRGMM